MLPFTQAKLIACNYNIDMRFNNSSQRFLRQALLCVYSVVECAFSCKSDRRCLRAAAVLRLAVRESHSQTKNAG